MNKLIKIMIALALCLSMVMALASCEMLPDELRATIDGLLGNSQEESEGEGEGSGETEGEEEEEECNHVPGDWFVDVKATCRQEGFQKQYCKVCWDLIAEEVIPKLDYHNYDNGVCKVCNATQTESKGITYGKDANGDTIVTGMGTCTDTSLYISATAPDGTPVVGIKSEAFRGTGIISLIVEEGVKYIEKDAFYGSSKLDRVKLPLSIESIGTNAFYLCPVRVATIPVLHCTAVKNDRLANLTLYGEGAIPDSAFIACSRLTTLTLEEGITAIGKNAFSNTSIVSLSMPDSLTKVGQSAFEYCKDLKVLKIGKNVKTIEDYAFQNSSFLDSVYIPESVTYIGYRAFYRCPRITSVTFEDVVGWVVTTSSTSTTGQVVAEATINDPAVAAEFIKTLETGYVKNLS